MKNKKRKLKINCDNIGAIVCALVMIGFVVFAIIHFNNEDKIGEMMIADLEKNFPLSEIEYCSKFDKSNKII